MSSPSQRPARKQHIVISPARVSLRQTGELELIIDQQKLDITKCAQHMILFAVHLTRDMALFGYSRVRMGFEAPSWYLSTIPAQDGDDSM